MAKRLTDTEKWKDDWYIQLSNDDKIVWQWLLDNCSHAGICKRSMGILNLMCKVNYTEEEMLKKMGNRAIIVGNNWFIPKFIKFQYTTLNSLKPVILSVVKELYANNLIGLIPSSFGNDYLIIGKSFDNHCEMIKDKDKSKDKEKKGGVGENKKQKGIKFNQDFTSVHFPDGQTQALGPQQQELASEGLLSPNSIIQGASY